METIEENSKSDISTISTSAKKIRICLVGEVIKNIDCVQFAQTLGIPVFISETGVELCDDLEWQTFFILEDFESSTFEAIYAKRNKHCIMSPIALKGGLKRYTRPVYNFSMRGVVACFKGLRDKDFLRRMVLLMHSMGGSMRRGVNLNVTHLICTEAGGDKYHYAKTFRLIVVRPDWVFAAWERRHEIDFYATADDFTKEHSIKAFEGLKICFRGFPPDEHAHMVDVLKSNGGIPVDIDDPECTHVVVDEHASPVKPVLKNLRMPIVKSDWFWYTIQNGYANEMDYLFTDFSDSITDTPNRDRRESLPISLNKRKRKRFSQRLQLEGTPFDSGKRRSSNSDGGLLSASGSFFDCTTTPDKLEPVESDALTCKQKSMRFNHFMDFYITESNYVGILDTIVNLFQKPLEEMADKNDALLSKSEIKEIFGNFLPIHVVHKDILQKLRVLHGEWSDDCLIGDIILQHRDDLITAYPPYVNYFEQMKDKLLQCDAQKPRFHAFLKINQTKPECGRQRLQDLMIRPVQRLPSTIILLKGILKYTSKDNPDYHPLEEALKAMNEVTTYIDEDKRKSNSRMAIFDIFKDIENCPAHLVSSNRDFISRCDVNELSDSLSGRGDALILYLFTDTLEVCKKRSRTFNSTKSPSSTKSYKHINLISLNAIRFVIDITDSPRAFAILCRQDNDELYAFSLIEGTDKMKYLKILCKQMAENACRTDPNKSLLYRTSQELEVDISNVNTSTLSKAIKLARTRFKVGRAFSFNKTPSKLKRAVSTMMTSPFGSTNSLTPASQLSQMRLASCTNINEVAQEDNCDDVQNKSPSKESEQ